MYWQIAAQVQILQQSFFRFTFFFSFSYLSIILPVALRPPSEGILLAVQSISFHSKCIAFQDYKCHFEGLSYRCGIRRNNIKNYCRLNYSCENSVQFLFQQTFENGSVFFSNSMIIIDFTVTGNETTELPVR